MGAEAPDRGGRRRPTGALAVAVILVLATIAVGVIGGGGRSASTSTPTPTPSPSLGLGGPSSVLTTKNIAPPPTGDPVRPRGRKAKPCLRRGAAARSGSRSQPAKGGCAAPGRAVTR